MHARVQSVALRPTLYMAAAWDHPTMETRSENQYVAMVVDVQMRRSGSTGS